MLNDDIKKVSGDVYSVFLASLQNENPDSLIKDISVLIQEIHRDISKHHFHADELVHLDSINSLQVKLFNSFMRELAKGNTLQCKYEFWDYIQQVFRNKKVLTNAEIMQIYSMCESFLFLNEQKR